MKMTVREKFEQYHAMNPQVYAAFVKVAFEGLERGMTVLSINHISEIVRWDMWVKDVKKNSPYKFCNTYRPYYSRLIMRQEPLLAGLFRTKQTSVHAQEASDQ